LQWIKLNTTTGNMRIDRTKQMEVIYEPSNTTDDTSVTWATADPAIATVSDTGLVTALTKGKTTITGTVLAGTDREMSATYSVTVIGLKDDKTGIIVTNSDDTDTEEGVGLTVDYINDSDSFAQTAGRVQQALDQYTLEDMQIYDITLTRNGTAVQPTTTMDVEIPVSEDMVSDDTVAYRLEEDGTLTNMGASYEDGRYGFEVDHFSIYVLGKKKEEDYLPGDLDGNKKVNPLDVVLLRKYIAEGYDVTINEAAADVNADNKVNTMDVIMLRRYIVGGYDVELIRRPKN
jgi:hypothetical protein